MASTKHSPAVVDAVPKELYLAGWRPASDGRRLAVEDPATGKELCCVADAAPADMQEALRAASEAQSEWAATSPRTRSDLLRAGFEAIMARLDDLALLLTLEMGKALSESRAEVLYAAEFLRWFSEEAVRVDGRVTSSPDGSGDILVSRQPVGPCLLITPWNFPLAMGTRKIGPAAAAGCTMIIKPAAETPLSMLALAGILDEVGFPAGVVNVLPTSRAAACTEAVINDPRLRKLSFTGSTEVGRRLMAQAAPAVLRMSMELGGNAPFLVFDDADLEAAVAGAMLAKLRNVGQSCTAANRFYVAADVADEFVSGLANAMQALTMGPGCDADTDIGPLVNAAALDKVAALVRDAVARGGQIVCGGRAADGPGYHYEPTVLVDVPDDAALLHTEIFGPVAPVARFTTDEEALALANATEYGLVAFVYTRDLTRARRVCAALDTGMVGLNRGVVSNPAAPFGGTKASGFGREGGSEGIEEFLSTKYVAVTA